MQRSKPIPVPVAGGLLFMLLAMSWTLPAGAGVVLTYIQVDPDADDPIPVVVEAEGDGLRVDAGGEIVVFRADQGVLWRIDPDAETHEAIDVARLRRSAAALEAERARLAEIVPGLVPGGEAEASRRMAEVLGGGAVLGPRSVRATGETGLVGAFEARAYDVMVGGAAVATVWTTHPDSVGVPEDALDVADRLGEAMGTASLAGSLARYLRDPRTDPPAGVPPGLPVRVIEHVGPHAGRRTELVSIREEAVAGSRFTVPAGSREVVRPVGL